MVRALLLLDLDPHEEELGRSKGDVVLPRCDRDLARENALCELGEIKRRGVPARVTAELRRDRRGCRLSASRLLLGGVRVRTVGPAGGRGGAPSNPPGDAPPGPRGRDGTPP